MAIKKIHHLNCGSMCPAAGGLLEGNGRLTTDQAWPCHCLLVETDSSGLVLIDTGIGTAECRDPSRFPPMVRGMLGPKFEIDETAVEQVRSRGFDPSEVRHVVVTHLDLDHAGGLSDFPNAKIHLHIRECYGANGPTLQEKGRYLPIQWAHGPQWCSYTDAGDDWFGFEAVRQLRGIEEDIALIPLFGHTRGHSGIAVRGADGWLLHVGDAIFRTSVLETPPRPLPRILKIFERINCVDNNARVTNVERLRELRADHASDVEIICSHDPTDLQRHVL